MLLAQSEAIAGVPTLVKCQSKSKTETRVLNEEYKVVLAGDPLFLSQYPYGTEAQKGHEEAWGGAMKAE